MNSWIFHPESENWYSLGEEILEQVRNRDRSKCGDEESLTMDGIEQELKNRRMKEESLVNTSGLQKYILRSSPESELYLIALWVRTLSTFPSKGFSIETRKTNESISISIVLTDPPQNSSGGTRAFEHTGYELYQKFLEKYFPDY